MEGNTYERAAILNWLRTKTTSPISRNPLNQNQLTDNRALKNAIHEHCERTGQEMPQPPSYPPPPGPRWYLDADYSYRSDGRGERLEGTVLLVSTARLQLVPSSGGSGRRRANTVRSSALLAVPCLGTCDTAPSDGWRSTRPPGRASPQTPLRPRPAARPLIAVVPPLRIIPRRTPRRQHRQHAPLPEHAFFCHTNFPTKLLRLKFCKSTSTRVQ